MAGYYRYTAVLDACVLYPAPLRDLLISLAADGLYGARWTAEIQDEWIRNLLVKRPDLDEQKLQHTKLKKPPKSAEEYLATLEQQGLPQTCQILRNAIDLI